MCIIYEYANANRSQLTSEYMQIGSNDFNCIHVTQGLSLHMYSGARWYGAGNRKINSKTENNKNYNLVHRNHESNKQNITNAIISRYF